MNQILRLLQLVLWHNYIIRVNSLQVKSKSCWVCLVLLFSLYLPLFHLVLHDFSGKRAKKRGREDSEREVMKDFLTWLKSRRQEGCRKRTRERNIINKTDVEWRTSSWWSSRSSSFVEDVYNIIWSKKKQHHHYHLLRHHHKNSVVFLLLLIIMMFFLSLLHIHIFMHL